MIDLNEDQSALTPYPELSALLSYWRTMRGERFAPSWTDIDMMAFPLSLLPRCLVIDVLAEESDFRYRFWGTAYLEIHGAELTGTRLSEMTLEGGQEILRPQYELIVTSRAPHYFANRMNTMKGLTMTYHVIRLPLSSDGETVDMLVSALVLDHVLEDWNPLNRQATAFVEAD